MSIDEVIKRYADKLMQLPNVNGVGEGRKGNKPIIIVSVTHKVPESDLQPQEIIPKSLEGYEIIVEETGFIEAKIGLV